jgi:hypothetical protein
LRRTLFLLAALATGPACAAEPPRVATVPPPAEGPQVPSGDIFGFTSPTDVGAPGDRGVAFETTSRFGRREGRYAAGTLKTQLGFTIAENLAVAISPFVTRHDIRDSAAFADLDRTQFDGLSGEVAWRFLPRTPQGLAGTLSVEPRWARVDALSGLRTDAFSIEFKLFVDTVLIPNTLYAALNLNYAPGTARPLEPELGPWLASSGTNVSLALAYQLSDTLFLGAEARALAAFEGAFLNRALGSAVFAGPNVFVRLNDRATINAAWTPQLAGRSRPSGGALDLDNFERHQLRVKAALSF